MIYKFCISYKDAIWYLEKTIGEVISAIEQFDLDPEMVSKWKTDILVHEKMK
jgi:hypothetical protein